MIQQIHKKKNSEEANQALRTTEEPPAQSRGGGTKCVWWMGLEESTWLAFPFWKTFLPLMRLLCMILASHSMHTACICNPLCCCDFLPAFMFRGVGESLASKSSVPCCNLTAPRKFSALQGSLGLKAPPIPARTKQQTLQASNSFLILSFCLPKKAPWGPSSWRIWISRA